VVNKSVLLLLVFCRIFISNEGGCSGFTFIEIDQSGTITASYALTTKLDPGLFSPVTSSEETISIFRGHHCTYQLARRVL